MKIEQQRSIDTSQFSQEDWKRLTDYVALLLTIERKMRKKASTPKGE